LVNEQELAEAERALLAGHVDSCEACRQRLELLRPTVMLNGADTSLTPSSGDVGETLAASPFMLRETADAARSKLVLTVPGYTLLEELGRGGMGVVYKARQESLGRLVALKMIRAAMLADTNQLTRFQIEAEILAQLQHPNIVQVFEIGQHQDMPYLAMEYVPGAALGDAIQKRGFTPNASAALVEKLARAMFSAHERGILHRDLKPANVLLNAEGDPKITDFGLAKRVSSDSQLTATHAVMGTPSYMPPEQALGRSSEIDSRSDIYSLGAILYELLTARPPFRGTTPLETLQQVIHREPAAPRSWDARIPRDLETICLKCLHKEPAQRYETAADLADDLRRFARGEPILARRVGPVERGWRWCRRNPAVAGSAALAGAAITLGSFGVAWQANQAEHARQQAQLQFQRFAAEADEKFQLIKDLMERVPEEERAQDERLQSALASYQNWLAEEPSDVTAQASYAEALFHVAEIRRRMGQFDLAEQVYGKARQVYEQLVATAPEEARYHQGLTETLNWLGENYRESGQLEQAVATYEEALTHQEALAARTPSEPHYRAEVARSLYNRALALRDLNRTMEAEQDLRRSISLLSQCLAERANHATFRQGLARSRANLGILLRASGSASDADREYLAAIELLQTLQGEFPRSTEYRLELATVLMNRANLLLADAPRKELQLAEPWTEAERSYRASVGIFRELSAEYGNVPKYRKELANSLNGLGAVLVQSGRTAEAEQTWTDSAAELTALIERTPNVAEYQHLLAQTTHNLAYLHRRDADTSRLISLLRSAVEYAQRARELSPQNALYARTLETFQRTLDRLLTGEKAEDE